MVVRASTSILRKWLQMCSFRLEGPSLSFESVFGFSKRLLLLIIEVGSRHLRLITCFLI